MPRINHTGGAMRTRKLWIPLAFGLLSLPMPAVPQQQLPKNMTGIWNATSIGRGGRPVGSGGTWSVVVEKQHPDGSIEGRMTWLGWRFCEMNDQPMTGKFDGNELTLRAKFQDKMPNAGCGAPTIVMNKVAGDKFEGGIPKSSTQYRLTLGAP